MTAELRAGLHQARRGALGLVLFSLFFFHGSFIIEIPLALIRLAYTARVIRGVRRMAQATDRSGESSLLLFEVSLVAAWLIEELATISLSEEMTWSWWWALSLPATALAAMAATNLLAAVSDAAGLHAAGAAWRRVHNWIVPAWFAPAVLFFAVSALVSLFPGEIELTIDEGPFGVVVLVVAVAASIVGYTPFFGLSNAAEITEQELQLRGEPVT